MNFNPVWNKNRIVFNHHENIPESFRMLIIGQSNCGKTNLLLKMLLTPNFLDYNNLIIFSSSINQDEYQLLFHAFSSSLSKETIIEIFQKRDNFLDNYTIKDICDYYKINKNENSGINIQLFDKMTNIMPPKDLNPNKKNLIIFDDCMNMKNQSIIQQYFTRGRHNSVNSIYLSQSYFHLDRQSIRGNSNMFIFFKLPQRDRSLIYSDLLSNTIEKEDFDYDCNNHYRQKYNYLVFNKDDDIIYRDIFSN